MADSTDPTHNALVKRFLDRARKQFVWLQIGTGRLNKDGTFDGMLDRMPIGGFSGYIHFFPIGTKPPAPPEPEPARPGPQPADPENSEEEP
jgi:hypothetical protein